MQRKINQRELRNDSGEIMRGVEAGLSFLVTRNGVPVGELVPIRKPRVSSKEDVLRVFARGPHVDVQEFRADLDAFLDPFHPKRLKGE